MYSPISACNLSFSWTPSQPKPVAYAIIERMMRMLGRQVPKPAKLPMVKKKTICIAKEIPLHKKTMILMERGFPANCNVPWSDAAWESRFWKAVGAKSAYIRKALSGSRKANHTKQRAIHCCRYSS